MKNENSVRLRHILEAVTQIEIYLHETDENEFVQDRKTQDAIRRQLEIVGEAVKNLSTELRETNTQIPWRKISGTRDKLAHGYFEVDLEKVWDTVQNDLPSFKTQIKKILEEELKK